jgi:ribosomal protein S18 acetylase RimI-like enzyme
MTTAAIEPARLESAQVKPAATVLARAFHTNPGMIWTNPDERSRPRKLTWFMSVASTIGERYGEVYTTPGGIEGAAIWMPPGQTTVSLGQMVRAGFLAAPLRLGVNSFLKFMRVFSRFEHEHKKTVPGDHWYLFVVGVDPPKQGQGIGSALMAPGLRKADEARLPCYLETDRPEDVIIYQKRGFEVVEKLSVGDSPPFWTMKRPART